MPIKKVYITNSLPLRLINHPTNNNPQFKSPPLKSYIHSAETSLQRWHYTGSQNILSLKKIIKIKFFGTFLILVMANFSSCEHSIFLTFLLIPTFCKSICLKHYYFPWHLSAVFYVFLIPFKRLYPMQWNWIFCITVKQIENIMHLPPIGWLMERQSIKWQATRWKTGFQFPTRAQGFVIKCIVHRTTAGPPSSGHVVKDGHIIKRTTLLQLPFKTRNSRSFVS